METQPFPGTKGMETTNINSSTIKKLKGLITLVRFELPFSAGVCVVMGQLLARGNFAPVHVTIPAFLSIFFISTSILVMNDYFDIETDKINAPNRPLPSNIVTSTEALLLTAILTACGFILSSVINYTALLCTIILTIIGFLYNWRFKKSGLPGNLMVSFSVGMTFIYGGVSVGLPFNVIVWFFGIVSALIDLGEEIAADAMDMKGDALIDSNSLAIKYGKPTALKTSSIIFIFVILLSFVPFILNWFPAPYWVPILIMDISIGYPLYRLLKAHDNEGRKYIRWIYLGSTFGLLVFIIMRTMKV